MKRKVSLYIRDTLQHMRDAEAFVQDMDYEQFVGDKKTLFAVLRAVEGIGEATKDVPDEVRARYLEIPRRKSMADQEKHGIIRMAEKDSRLKRPRPAMPRFVKRALEECGLSVFGACGENLAGAARTRIFHPFESCR